MIRVRLGIRVVLWIRWLLLVWYCALRIRLSSPLRLVCCWRLLFLFFLLIGLGLVLRALRLLIAGLGVLLTVVWLRTFWVLA